MLNYHKLLQSDLNKETTNAVTKNGSFLIHFRGIVITFNSWRKHLVDVLPSLQVLSNLD